MIKARKPYDMHNHTMAHMPSIYKQLGSSLNITKYLHVYTAVVSFNTGSSVENVDSTRSITKGTL